MEWAAWLQRHRSRLPLPPTGSTLSELETKISAETGRNMLFLSPFIRPTSQTENEWTWEAAWAAFLRVKEVRRVHQNLRDFTDKFAQASNVYMLSKSLNFMVTAICRAPHIDMPSYYDARYFCVMDGIARTVGQYVSRCAASVIEAHSRLDLFREGMWINSIRDHRGNPSVQGFLVEKAALSYLSTCEVVARVLRRPELRHERVAVRTFQRDTEASSLTSSHVVTLYIPEEFNYKAVDAVLRIVERVHEKTLPQPQRQSKRRKAYCGVEKVNPPAAAAASSSRAAAVPVDEGDDDVDVADGLRHKASAGIRLLNERGPGSAAAAFAAQAGDADIDVQSSTSYGGAGVGGTAASASARPSDRGVPWPRTFITLIPIQITMAGTISQTKLDKSFRFFERRAAWTADFKDDASAHVDLRFAFVVRQCAMQADRAAVPVDRDGTSTFALSFISLATIDAQLDRAVDSPAAAGASAANSNSPPRLHLSDTSSAASTSRIRAPGASPISHGPIDS